MHCISECADNKSWYGIQSSFILTNTDSDIASNKPKAQDEKGISIEQQLSAPEWFKKVAENFALPQSEFDGNAFINETKNKGI